MNRTRAEYAHQLAGLSQNVLLVQASTDLIKATVANELQPLRPDYPIVEYHSGCPTTTRTGTVLGDIVDHIETATPRTGQIVLITWTSFLKLPFINRDFDWEVVLGEKPECLKRCCLGRA